MKTASWRCRRGASFAEKFPTRYRRPVDASFSTLENDRVRLSFTRSTRGAAFQPHRNRRLDDSASAGRAVKHAKTVKPLNSLTACNADTADTNFYSYGNPPSRHCGARDGDFASPARTNRPARIPISENIPPAVFSASPLLPHDDRRAALSPLLFASRMTVRKLYAAFDCFWCRMCYNVGNRTRVLTWRKPTWTLWKS